MLSHYSIARPKRTPTCLVAIAIAAVGFSQAATASDKLTDFDRAPKKSLWEKIESPSEPNSVTGMGNTITTPATGVGSQNNVVKSGIYKRLKATKDGTKLDDLIRRTDRYETEDLPEWEERVSSLEGMEYWESVGEAAGAWRITDTVDSTSWSPAITNQPADFVQSRWVRYELSKSTDVTERNLDTGEIRVISSIDETKLAENQEERSIQARQTPSGSGNGWSPETITAYGVNCRAFSPHRNTIEKGVVFDQSRTCYNTAEKEIYYLTSGTAIDNAVSSRNIPYTELNPDVVGTYVPLLPDYLTYACAPGDEESNESRFFVGPTSLLSVDGQWGIFFVAGSTMSIGFNAPTQANPFIEMTYGKVPTGRKLYAGREAPTPGYDNYAICLQK